MQRFIFCRVLDIRVPEVVKTHLLAVCVLQNQLQSVVDRTGVERQILQHRRREHPAGVIAFTVFFQHLHDGGRQYQIIAADTTKTRSSRRTLPLVPTVREMLLRLKEQQEQNRKICGQSYSREFADYICVNKLGGTDSPSISFQLFQQSAGTKPLAAYPLSRPAPQLRNAAAGAWCAAQTDSGVAGAQRFQHDSQHLRAP